MKEKIWLDCCRSSGCPQVAIEGATVWIKDDDEKVVTMSVDQLLDVARTVQEHHSSTAEPQQKK